MAFYRGGGGPGDATNDAANEAILAIEASKAAVESAAAAAQSAAAAGNYAASAQSSANTAVAVVNTSLLKANNLSDLTNVTTARTNLGLGTAATTDATDYATAAQGALADTAVQPTSSDTLTNKIIDSITNSVGADHIHFKIKATEAISKGNVLRVTGYNTGEEAIEVAKVTSSSHIAVGVAHDTLSSGSFGALINTGILADIDTSAFSVGAVLYPNTSGGFTATKPTSGTYQALAYVLRSHANHGIILIEATEPNTVLGSAATTSSSDYATAAQGSNADTAYGWGDHSTEGYLTSYTETDPIYVASSWYSTTNNASNWDTAYGWGNHASAGYLTSYTETDPVYVASSWYSTTNNSSNWDTAFGWGNHASAGYATYPTQTGNSGKFLTTDGTNTSWAVVNVSPALDDLSDVTITSATTGQVLSYNGTGWVNSASGGGAVASGAMYENSQSISANYTITSGKSAMSSGPVAIASGVTVTIPTGSRWVVL